MSSPPPPCAPTKRLTKILPCSQARALAGSFFGRWPRPMIDFHPFEGQLDLPAHPIQFRAPRICGEGCYRKCGPDSRSIGRLTAMPTHFPLRFAGFLLQPTPGFARGLSAPLDDQEPARDPAPAGRFTCVLHCWACPTFSWRNRRSTSNGFSVVVGSNSGSDCRFDPYHEVSMGVVNMRHAHRRGIGAVAENDIPSAYWHTA